MRPAVSVLRVCSMFEGSNPTHNYADGIMTWTFFRTACDWSPLSKLSEGGDWTYCGLNSNGSMGASPQRWWNWSIPRKVFQFCFPQALSMKQHACWINDCFRKVLLIQIQLNIKLPKLSKELSAYLSYGTKLRKDEEKVTKSRNRCRGVFRILCWFC